MKQDDIAMNVVFSAILQREGVAAPIEKINAQELRDEPGFHWSNPGLKLVHVTAGVRQFAFVVKRLGKHARREVLVYRFLSNHPAFPIPRLFHDVYDDSRDEYLIVTERCIGRPIDS